MRRGHGGGESGAGYLVARCKGWGDPLPERPLTGTPSRMANVGGSAGYLPADQRWGRLPRPEGRSSLRVIPLERTGSFLQAMTAAQLKAHRFEPCPQPCKDTDV